MFSFNIAAVILGFYSIPSYGLLLREVQPNNTFRNERMFSFFSSSSSSRNDESCSTGTNFGICVPSSRCRSKGGETISGPDCRSGSTCCRSNCTANARRDDPCIITRSGTIVTKETGLHNNYRIRYRYRKPKGICQVRLDFIELVLAGPSGTGDCNSDVLQVRGLSICGLNNGQHVYLDYGETTNIDISLRIATDASRYSIRNTFIACNSENRAPANCLQYFTSLEGTVRSFNFVENGTDNQHSNNQRYSICVKAAFGMNSIRWKACQVAEAFFVTGGPMSGQPKTLCEKDFVQVFGEKQHCGKGFISLTSMAKPFLLHVNFDEAEGISVQLPTDPLECNLQVTDPYSGYLVICEQDPPGVCQCRLEPQGPGVYIPDAGNTGFCLNYFQLT